MCDLKLEKNSDSNISLKTSYQTFISELDIKKKLDKEILTTKETFIDMIEKANPKFLENFEILDFLNSGSNGFVYKGIYKITNRHVAIKIRRKKPKKNDYKVIDNKDNKINQEIIISEKLHNIKVIETIANININPYINISILEFGKNGDLNYFIKYLLHRKYMSETTLNYFSKQILEGLEYIHKCKIVHMDIKPGNIIIDSSLCVKIADFGVSRSYENFEPNNIVRFPFVGTSKYMAPEILRKDNLKVKYSEKIDMYSLGVTLYYLYFCDFPYKLSDIKDKEYDKIKENINKEKLEFPPDRKISNLFKNFLEKILDKNYIHRMGIKEALNHPWIKANKAIMEEKENLGCLENFLVKLITDNIRNFNNLIKLK